MAIYLDRLYEQVLDDPSLNEAQKLKELANKIITSLYDLKSI